MTDLDMNKVHERVDDWFEVNERADAKPEMVWVDIETTGLNYIDGSMLELSIFITDAHGFLVSNGVRTWNILQSMDILENVERDPIVGPMHTASGLLEELKNGKGARLQKVEEQAVSFVSKILGETKLPLAGSNVANFDRKWLFVHMPALEALFHYRNADVSSVKEFARLLNPRLLEYIKAERTPMAAHRGVPDLVDSIEEYRFYIAEFLWTQENIDGTGLRKDG